MTDSVNRGETELEFSHIVNRSVKWSKLFISKSSAVSQHMKVMVLFFSSDQADSRVNSKYKLWTNYTTN